MYRRILFVGIVPLMSRKNLMRGAVGMGFSLVSMVCYREVMPFRIDTTNALAYVAQVVVFLTYAVSLLVDLCIWLQPTVRSDQSHPIPLS